MSDYFLAHYNVVRPLGDFSISTPESQYFFSQLKTVIEDSKADQGLLWHRHGVRAPDGRNLEFFDIVALQTCGLQNPHIYTLAGWKDARALHQFAYRQHSHVEGMKRLRHWVDRSEGATMVMWWEERNVRITGDMAWDRLCRLRRDGPGPHAFSLQQRFDPPGLKLVG